MSDLRPLFTVWGTWLVLIRSSPARCDHDRNLGSDAGRRSAPAAAPAAGAGRGPRRPRRLDRRAVIGSGLIDERFSLTASVGIVAIGLAAMATAVAAWQVRARPARVRAHPAST
jgi:hypothetical protein